MLTRLRPTPTSGLCILDTLAAAIAAHSTAGAAGHRGRWGLKENLEASVLCVLHDRAYLLRSGLAGLQGRAHDLLAGEGVQKACLG
jgi:hypothetical protein